MVYGETDEDGFFVGERHGRRGLVPSNFLQEFPEEDVETELPSGPPPPPPHPHPQMMTTSGPGRPPSQVQGPATYEEHQKVRPQIHHPETYGYYPSTRRSSSEGMYLYGSRESQPLYR